MPWFSDFIHTNEGDHLRLSVTVMRVDGGTHLGLPDGSVTFYLGENEQKKVPGSPNPVSTGPTGEAHFNWFGFPSPGSQVTITMTLQGQPPLYRSSRCSKTFVIGKLL